MVSNSNIVMYRKKWANMPQLPKDLEIDAFDNEKFMKTYNGANRFLLVDENDQRITIFSSPLIINAPGTLN